MSDNVEKDFEKAVEETKTTTASETPMMDKLKNETTVFVDPCQESFSDRVNKFISRVVRYELEVSQ